MQKPERCSGLPLPKLASRTRCACKFGRLPLLQLGCFCRWQRLAYAATHSSLLRPMDVVPPHAWEPPLSVSLRSTALPEGEPSARPWTEANFVVRRTFLRLCLTTNFAAIDAGTLGSPRGGAVERSETERGASEKHKYTKSHLPASQNALPRHGAKWAEKIGSKEKKAKTKNL